MEMNRQKKQKEEEEALSKKQADQARLDKQKRVLFISNGS